MTAKIPSPPKRKPDNRVVRVEWEPHTLTGIDVRLYKATHYTADGREVIPAGVPTVDPSYVFRDELVREFAWAVWPHDNDQPTNAKNWTPLLFSGPRGSGKTSFFVQMAALRIVPLFRAN